jgi:hypothetical protein
MGVTVLGTRPLHSPTDGARPAWLRPPAVEIRRRPIPYWRERGWRCADGAYLGTYQTRFGSFLGRIEDRGFGHFRFYITDPPAALRRSPHWACFQPRGGKGYRVHMARRPRDVGSGILTIERLITEAFEL